MSVAQGCVEDRILIVDDEEGIRELFRMMVASRFPGLTCEEAVNGSQALEAFRRGHHALLLMDLNMPIMDGLTSFQRLQHYCVEASHAMPSVIFCTGFAPPDTVARIVQADGRHALLRKPVRREVLLGAIRARLANGSGGAPPP